MLSVGKKKLHNKWVYRVREDNDDGSNIENRLVILFQQKEEY